MLRVGIDVGGTNTDAVLMNEHRLLSWHKAPTSADIGTGICEAVQAVLGQAGVPASALAAVMIGTTQFTNALVEAKRLSKVGVLRIALPAAQGVPPLTDWPDPLLQAIRAVVVEVGGGHRFDGQPYAPLDEAAVLAAADRFVQEGVEAVAISGVFSVVNPRFEQRAAELLGERMPAISLTLSSEIGKAGLIERENAAVLNAALAGTAVRVIHGFRDAFSRMGVAAPLYISQNDGTLMSLQRAQQYPVLSFASGPTNSMRGAGYLCGIRDGVVVDIGGTTADVGVLADGFPRESSLCSDIAGVRTNFRMPDVHALGMGGGSRVRVGESGAIRIGPDSVGFELLQRARCFGGDTLTLTDLAVRAGRVALGEPGRLADLSDAQCGRMLDVAQGMLCDAIDRMRTAHTRQPVLLVGGGSALVDTDIHQASTVLRPEHAGVANAIGAAIAQVSGEVDQTTSLANGLRTQVLAALKRKAMDAAIAAGARAETVEVVDIQETPLAYLPGEHARLRVRAVGELAL